MIRIFFKTLWNNRRRNILVFTELFMISLVLVNLTIFLSNMLVVYRIKNCYDAHNVVLVNIYKKNNEDKEITNKSLGNLIQTFGSNSFVESVSISNSAVPYSYNLISNNFRHDSDRFQLALRYVDLDYAKVMKITPLKGRWFNETDIGKKAIPIIVSREIDDKYFQGSALGNRIMNTKDTYEIVGVVDPFKRSDIEKPYPFGFLFENQVSWGASVLIRTKENKTGDMLSVAESQVKSTLNPENWTISSLNSLENMRDKQNDQNYQRNYLSVIIALFIMINIFLGTVGILWYNTNLRIHEIGIKRALGSTRAGIRKLLIAENMFLAGLGLLIVVLIILQIPTFFEQKRVEEGVLSLSIWISVATTIILVLLSTWIPASLASKIHPATALKTE
jgi:putative ABC transport system permease protein